MDELVMTIAATARETRILLMQGPDEVMKARLRAVSMPAHRFAGPMLCEAMALWHDQRVRAVVSAESEDVLFALGLYFCGVTRQWLFDNPKIVVLERHGDAVRFHPELLTLSGQLCVALRLCGVRKPQQKGKVERAIRYLRERFFAVHDSRSRPGQRRAPRLLRHDRQRASPSTLAPAARRRGASRGAEPPARAARPAP
jgi:hypothetical protein